MPQSPSNIFRGGRPSFKAFGDAFKDDDSGSRSKASSHIGEKAEKKLRCLVANDDEC